MRCEGVCAVRALIWTCGVLFGNFCGGLCMQVMICAHPWKMIQAEQYTFGPDEEKIPAIMRCPICQTCKKADEPDPRIVLGIIEEAS